MLNVICELKHNLCMINAIKLQQGFTINVFTINVQTCNKKTLNTPSCGGF